MCLNILNTELKKISLEILNVAHLMEVFSIDTDVGISPEYQGIVTEYEYL